jgi:hypothetical protein
MIEKTYEFHIDIHQLFIDYKQAYDSINCQQMYKIMKELGIPEKLINLIKMTLRKILNKVQISGKLSDSFETTCGLRQGNALSTVLFNIMLEKVICSFELNSGGSIFTRTRQYMAYADDTVFIGRSLQTVSEVIQQVEELALIIGLDINVGKTKYINFQI